MVNDRVDIHSQNSESALETNNDGMIIHVPVVACWPCSLEAMVKTKPVDFEVVQRILNNAR